MNCYIFRVLRDNDFVINELKVGRVRQGWGATEMALLKSGDEVSEKEWIDKYLWKDESYEIKKRKYFNLKNMLNMTKGDIIIIPRYPQWEEFTVATVKETYKFNVPSEINDFGHIIEIDNLTKKSVSYNSSEESKKIKAKFRAYQNPINNVWSQEIKNAAENILFGKITENVANELVKIEEEKTEFNIKADTWTLETLIKDRIDREKIGYVIPIYQRPYSWKEEQVKRLLDDIFEEFCETQINSDGKDEIKIKNKSKFIGTMQLSSIRMENNLKIQDIIDGQQRLTTLNLLLLYLEGDRGQKLFKTEVGGQEELLNDIFKGIIGNENDLKSIGNSNQYLKNYIFIKKEIEEKGIESSEEVIDELIKYIKTKLYFVVIETQAGLSETLKIFDIINTSGLDLNGADLFKIKMYEYLHEIKKQEKGIFQEIDSLYEEVFKRNEELRIKNREGFYSAITMQNILALYRDYIVSFYKLPNHLLTIGVDTFFEKLFDSLIKGKNDSSFISHENIKKIAEVGLKLEDLKKISEARFKWEEIKNTISLQSSFEEHYIYWSRYGRYFNFIYFYLMENDNLIKGSKEFKNMEILLSKISKMFILYSVSYAKQINYIVTFMGEIYSAILHKTSFENIIKKIEDSVNRDDVKKLFNDRLNEPMANKYTVKNLICRLSAMFYELESDKIKSKEQTLKLIFKEAIDIEHIQAYTDCKDVIQVRESWGEELDCLGNLIVLESNINRSIGNLEFTEKLIGTTEIGGYKKSNYAIMSEFIKENSRKQKWSKEDALERKKKEIGKIVDYVVR